MTSSRDRYGQTPLMNAAAAGRVDEVRRLLAEGVELDVTAKYGLTALMLAVIRGHGEVAELLIQAGADRSVRGRGPPGFLGRTALDLARDRGDARLVELLEGAPSRAPAFESLGSWAEAEELLPFSPLRPADTLGLELRALAVHVRNHRGRELSPEARSLEAHYDGLTFAQSMPGAEEARRLALEVAYGADPVELRIGPREGRAYPRGPDPAPDDPDPPLPAVVTWCEGRRHFLVASAELSIEELIRFAGSVHR